MSWLRPSNSSGSVLRPSGPTKRYSFSTGCQGRARRAAASWSRLRVNAFSFASSFFRAAIHAFSETTACRLAIVPPLSGDPPGFGEVLLPVWRVELVAAHVLTGGRRMDEAAVAEVDADVRVLLAFQVEKEEVAAPQAREPQRPRYLALRFGAVGQVDAHLPVAVLDEPAAVEAGGDRGAAEVVGTAAHGGGLRGGTIAGRGAHLAARGRRGWA